MREAVTLSDEQGQAADAIASRIWYAVAQPGETMDGAVLIAGLALCIAKMAEYYYHDDAVIDEIARVAKDARQQLRTTRKPM